MSEAPPSPAAEMWQRFKATLDRVDHWVPFALATGLVAFMRYHKTPFDPFIEGLMVGGTLPAAARETLIPLIRALKGQQ